MQLLLNARVTVVHRPAARYRPGGATGRSQSRRSSAPWTPRASTLTEHLLGHLDARGISRTEFVGAVDNILARGRAATALLSASEQAKIFSQTALRLYPKLARIRSLEGRQAEGIGRHRNWLSRRRAGVRRGLSQGAAQRRRELHAGTTVFSRTDLRGGIATSPAVARSQRAFNEAFKSAGPVARTAKRHGAGSRTNRRRRPAAARGRDATAPQLHDYIEGLGTFPGITGSYNFKSGGQRRRRRRRDDEMGRRNDVMEQRQQSRRQEELAALEGRQIPEHNC